MGELILSIDQGTSATKACILEPPATMVAAARVPVKTRSPTPGAVEQDPLELVSSCRAAAELAIRDARIRPDDLAGCALANTGESFLLFGTAARPVTPVIGWQDSRVGTVIAELADSAERINRLTGLPLHAEFTAPKAAHWLRSLKPTSGLRFGTLDTWIANCLDPSGPYVTDRATASRTMLLGLDDEDWNDELLELFGIDRNLLPEIRPCDSMDVTLDIAGHELPLLASGYDTGLALLGHGCLDRGDAKASFGTCLGVMAASGEDYERLTGLLTTIAYTRGRQFKYALDGEIAAAGSLVTWAVEIGLAESPRDLDRLASSVEDSGGAILVPAITGLGAPYWRDDVVGRIVGLTPAVTRAHLARAVFDAIAFSLLDVLAAMRAGGLEVTALRVDGGLTRSELLMQRCADVGQLPLIRAQHEEATAFGGAALAMLASGRISEGELQSETLSGARTIEPSSRPSQGELDSWQRAVAEVLA